MVKKETQVSGWKTTIFLDGDAADVQREIDEIMRAYPPLGYRTRIIKDGTDATGWRKAIITRDSNSD